MMNVRDPEAAVSEPDESHSECSTAVVSGEDVVCVDRGRRRMRVRIFGILCSARNVSPRARVCAGDGTRLGMYVCSCLVGVIVLCRSRRARRRSREWMLRSSAAIIAQSTYQRAESPEETVLNAEEKQNPRTPYVYLPRARSALD